MVSRDGRAGSRTAGAGELGEEFSKNETSRIIMWYQFEKWLAQRKKKVSADRRRRGQKGQESWERDGWDRRAGRGTLQK